MYLCRQHKRTRVVVVNTMTGGSLSSCFMDGKVAMPSSPCRHVFSQKQPVVWVCDWQAKRDRHRAAAVPRFWLSISLVYYSISYLPPLSITTTTTTTTPFAALSRQWQNLRHTRRLLSWWWKQEHCERPPRTPKTAKQNKLAVKSSFTTLLKRRGFCICEL